MQLKEVQKKYPVFRYQNYRWRFNRKNFEIDFTFSTGTDVLFKPRIVIKNVSFEKIKNLPEEILDNLVFHLGLVELPTYWKAFCSPRIGIECGFLDREQIIFWRSLFLGGMGQFFYENKLPFVVPDWQICCPKPKRHPDPLAIKPKNRVLVPMGGGKDSLVTLELLRKSEKDPFLFALNPNKPLKDVCRAAKAPLIVIERQIDRQLLLMNKKGFFNGHTPFSALLAFYSVAAAVMFDCCEVAISQEKSSNEGNLKYLGRKINHQYSKSFDFEKKFRFYCQKFLAKNISYFSFLRPLYELQIAKMFSNYPKYFPYFLSCNKPFTLAGRAAGRTDWCGKCPKCLSVFSMLYPFIGQRESVKIFNKNLFEDKNLISLMEELLGETTCKPFECVGTFNEARAAFYLSLKAAKSAKGSNLPILLEVFEKRFLPRYKDMEKQSKKIISSWSNAHNLSLGSEKILRTALNKKTALAD